MHTKGCVNVKQTTVSESGNICLVILYIAGVAHFHALIDYYLFAEVFLHLLFFMSLFNALTIELTNILQWKAKLHYKCYLKWS